MDYNLPSYLQWAPPLWEYMVLYAWLLWFAAGVALGSIFTRACFLVRQRANLHLVARIKNERRDLL